MALTAGRKITERANRLHSAPTGPVAIWAGAMVALKAGDAIPAREGVGADNAAKAAEVATLTVVGVAEENRPANGDPTPYRPGVFLFDNQADDLIARADIGKPAYAVDDHTVGKTSPNNIRAKAGTIVDVDPGAGVWVRVGV